MSDFEIRANNIWTGIQSTRQCIQDFGYSQDSENESVSRVIGMFITWLTSCEEARQNDLGRSGSFTQTVISNLPIINNPNWDTYIEPSPTSSLKARAEALWGIRIAFTHCDGNVNNITNLTNQNFARNSVNILPGVSLNNNKLVLNEGISHYAIRSLSQIHDLLV